MAQREKRRVVDTLVRLVNSITTGSAYAHGKALFGGKRASHKSGDTVAHDSPLLSVASLNAILLSLVFPDICCDGVGSVSTGLSRGDILSKGRALWLRRKAMRLFSSVERPPPSF